LLDKGSKVSPRGKRGSDRIVVETSQFSCSENGNEREGMLLVHYPRPGPDCIAPTSPAGGLIA